jgi:hypothetical protein
MIGLSLRASKWGAMSYPTGQIRWFRGAPAGIAKMHFGDQSSTIFSSNIRKWNSKPEADKTWPMFKANLKEAQWDINWSQPAITTDSLGFHGQANAAAIVNQVIECLSAEQQMQQEIQQEMANATQQQQNMIKQMQPVSNVNHLNTPDPGKQQQQQQQSTTTTTTINNFQQDEPEARLVNKITVSRLGVV